MRYFEPFIGGGAVCFSRYGVPSPFKWTGGKRRLLPEIVAAFGDRWTHRADCHISDMNADLINVYHVMRDNNDELRERLEAYQNLYDLAVHEGLSRGHGLDCAQDLFYSIRAVDPTGLTQVEQAARLIFLIQTCFNGLYRVNQRGSFNTPYGKYRRATIVAPTLKLCGQALRDCHIAQGDFEVTTSGASDGDLVYFDPPYIPISATSAFTGYTAAGFTMADQERLAWWFTTLVARGATCVASNAYSPTVVSLYSEHTLYALTTQRTQAAMSGSRGAIQEYLIVGGKS